MMILPEQKFYETRNFTITGKKFNGCQMGKQLIVTTFKDENGNLVPQADGNSTWYAVQKFNSYGVPAGRRYFGGNSDKAVAYYQNNNF